MKYIKESGLINFNLEELKEYSNNCLLDIIDKNFTIKFLELSSSVMVNIIKEGIDENEYFYLEEILEEFIFAITMITSRYNLDGREPFNIGYSTYTLEKLKKEEVKDIYGRDIYTGSIKFFISKRV